jgi:hypothetical protein
MMKMSEIRFHFFGEQDALENQDLDFFVDPNINQMYLQAKTMTADMQKKQNVMQMRAQEQQLEQGEMQMQQADMQTQQQAAASSPTEESPQGVAQSDQQGSSSQQPAAPEKKPSAKEEYKNRMQKSMKSYFRDWLDANQEEG